MTYKTLVLLASSKQQRKYFNALVRNVTLPLELLWYKRIILPSIFCSPNSEVLLEQVKLLEKRKRTAKKGLPGFFWGWFRFSSYLQANWTYRVAYRFLKQRNVALGVWNGKKFRQAIWIVAAKDLKRDVVFFETGPLPGYSAVDPVGVDYYSAAPRELDFYHKYTCSEQLPVLTMPLTDKPSSLPSSYIFIPFQVIEDSNIYLHSPWIKDMRDLYEKITLLSNDFPDKFFVIKPHPACPEKYDDLFALSEQTEGRIRFVFDLPTTCLVEHSETVLTVNSTVGMEALMARKKVIVLGQAIYGVEGIVKLAHSLHDLENVFNSLEQWHLDENLINQYLCYLKNDYAVRGDAMKSPDNEHWIDVTAKLSAMLSGHRMSAIGLEDD
ncbi:capsule polysaccharide biosynthesis [Hydrogenovibrio crunogenus]|uniref:Capsule polysaccharide biosynthesis n=1 Tax=Hydrogenovibrio crunogenus TaxID=39765 RepID=A0A4P7P0U4_9GAMM|nr:hypothetical protein [Hydrogenovibrio crunogenus]QBZ83549.1 capsule polysaccharide biosynthesis [Hydrogenovibrio crunogenus]